MPSKGINIFIRRDRFQLVSLYMSLELKRVVPHPSQKRDLSAFLAPHREQ